MLLGLAVASAFVMLPVVAAAVAAFAGTGISAVSVAMAGAAVGGVRVFCGGGNRQSGAARHAADRDGAGCSMLIGITGALIATSTWWNSEDAALIAGEIRSGHGYEGVDEYEPLATTARICRTPRRTRKQTAQCSGDATCGNLRCRIPASFRPTNGDTKIDAAGNGRVSASASPSKPARRLP